MEFEKLVAPTITEMFESRIESAILSGELKIGERLPSERELAEQTGISKSAVHLGIKNLERAGFIRIEPRQGMYVANWAETGDIETLNALIKSNVLRLEYDNIRSLVLIRELIEGDGMTALAKKHTAEDMEKLRSFACGIRDGGRETPPKKAEVLAEYAYKFTHYICFRSGNPFYSLIMNSFKPFAMNLWTEWIRQVGSDAAAGYLDRTAEELERGDGEAARKTVHDYNAEFLEKLR